MFAYHDLLLEEQQEFTPKSNKTEEEIRRLTLDEDIDEVRRAILLLTKGEIVQKKAILQNLVTLIRRFPSAFPTILGLLKQLLKSQDPECKSMTAKQLYLILEWFVHIASSQELQDRMYSEVLNLNLLMLEQWHEKTLQSWLLVFSTLIMHKEFPSQEKEVLTVILRLSDPKEIMPIRIAAIKAIGFLSQVMKNRLKGVFLDRIRSCCRDTEMDMRFAVVSEVLPRLAKNLTNDLFCSYFMQRIFEMVYDNEAKIKTAILKLILLNTQIFSNEEKQTRLVNIYLEHLHTDVQEALIMLSRHCGQIYLKLRQYLQKNGSGSSLFLSAVKSYGANAHSQLKIGFLYNLPGLIYYMDLKLWAQVEEEYVKLLLEEEDLTVRKHAYGIFHEVVQLCGIKNFHSYPQILMELIINCTQQPEPKKKKQLLTVVLPALIQNIDIVIQAIHRHSLMLQQKQQSTESIQKLLEELFALLMQYLKQLATYPSKPMQLLYFKISCSVRYFKMPQITKQYVPIIFAELACFNQGTCQPCLKSLAEVLFFNSRKIDTDLIIKKMQNEFLNVSHCLKNMVFVKIAAKLLECFSFEKYRSYKLFECVYSLRNTKFLEVQLSLINYVLQCSKLLIATQQESHCIHQIKTTFKNIKNPILDEMIAACQIQQKQHQLFIKDIKNQQRLRHEDYTKDADNQDRQQLDFTTNKIEIKKTVVFKQKKNQYSTKNASKFQAKINISLSTNTLGIQGSTKPKSSAKDTNAIKMISTDNKKLIETISKTKNINFGDTKIEGTRKKKPSIQTKGLKQFLRKDVDKRSSLDVSKKRKFITEKRID